MMPRLALVVLALSISSQEKRVYVGFSFRTLPDDLANEIGVEGGVEVRAVAAESPAEKGGLRTADIIREVNGRRVDTAAGYKRLLADFKPGDTITFSVIRHKKDREIRVVCGDPGMMK